MTTDVFAVMGHAAVGLLELEDGVRGTAAGPRAKLTPPRSSTAFAIGVGVGVSVGVGVGVGVGVAVGVGVSAK